MKVAIIGTGISGISAAYALNSAGHDICVYEKNDYIGGHSRTIDVDIDGRKQPVDTGFIVLNDRNYPHLRALFDHLGVPYENSDMSFGADIKNGWLQYSSKNVFKRWQNIIRPSYWKMLIDIIRFNANAKKYLGRDSSFTIRQCLDEMKMGKWFQDYYLQAMGAAIWSCPVKTIEQFPAKTFIRFFENHGLLTINNHPQWFTVSGGSREYTKRLTANFIDKIKLSCGVQSVRRENDKCILTDEADNTETFDKVIFACHADTSVRIIEDLETNEKDVLGAFTYQDNKIVVHSDESFMPSDTSCWASWIYISERLEDNQDAVSLSYWMNNLQNFETDKPLLVTLNPARMPQKNLIYDQHDFNHPVFNKAAIDAQDKVSDIQGQGGFYHVGAYQRYGFHEDGILSAVRILEKMGVKIPWN